MDHEENCDAIVGTLNAWLEEAGAEITGFTCGEMMAVHRQPCGHCNAVLYPIGNLITSNDCEGDVFKANSVLPLRLQCSDECPDCGYRYSHLYGPYELSRTLVGQENGLRDGES